MKNCSWSLVWVVIMVAVLAVEPERLAEASVNLPLHHWAYEAIERLVALGVIDRAMLVPKPYSRKEAARYVGRAIELARGDRVPRDGREVIAEPLLYRLMQELRPELLDLGVVSNGPATRRGWIRYGGRAQVEVDSFQVGQGTVRFRENRGGEYYADGTQVQTDVRGWVELTDVVALSAQPKFISDSNTLGFGATNNSRNVFMRELNAKVSLFNIAVEVGRGSLWWGPGYHGSLLLTDHAFPLDRITLGSDEPFRLPWVFRSLGEWKLNSFLAQLERDRDFPRANVFGLRVSYLPASWLELGFTRLTQFDGRGRRQSFPEAVFDAYSNAPNQIGDLDVNEQFMVDLRAGVPRVPYLVPFPAGLQLYGELGSEDKWSKIPIPSRAAFLVGIYIPQVFRGSSTDLRIEYADTDFTRRKTTDNLQQIWYNNGTYKSGMRFKGFPLGHHMGTDAIDVFVRTTRYLTDDLQLGANFNLQERDRGQSPHETKREAAVDLTWWVSPKIEFTAGYTYQRIKNPGEITSINPFAETFTGGVTSTNHFLWTNLAVQF
ncbi:capsule assembly Wzi family protein [Nitrospiraceae bacterium AH_259_D15_M11_P09]|nr:capsule assembly Wzi family protein [Nitrospiraceae bacterium AH_259_D15_M11_P09]